LALIVPAGQHYDHAPIVEAILEIRVVPWETQDLDALATTLAAPGYQDATPDYSVTAEMGFDGDEVVSRASRQHVGFSALRDDGRRAIRAWSDRYTFSWLKPYEDWDSFIAEALDGWGRYREVARPATMVRIGCRFINRLDLDRPSIEVKDYLRTSIDISPYLPQAMASFFAQVEIPLPQGAVSRVLTTLAAPEQPDTTSLILDIDTWRNVEIDLATDVSISDVEAHLDVLRDAKNYVFEACITDATRGVIR